MRLIYIKYIIIIGLTLQDYLYKQLPPFLIISKTIIGSVLKGLVRCENDEDRT